MIAAILLVQAVAFAVLAGIVASNKNRNLVGWGVLGFLFGPFAFIAALVVEEAEQAEMPPSSQRQNQSSGAGEFNPEEHEKKCPVCAEYIKLEARGCKHCGHEFSEEEVREQISKVREELQDQAKDDFHYGELNIYTHISIFVSFLASLYLVSGSIYFLFYFPIEVGSNFISVAAAIPFIALPLIIVSAGFIFIYSTYCLYTNNVSSMLGFTISLPVYLFCFSMIGISEISSANFRFYSDIRIILSLTALLVIASIYYLYRKSNATYASYMSFPENQKEIFVLGLSSLVPKMKRNSVGEIFACVSFILFLSAAAIGFFVS